MSDDQALNSLDRFRKQPGRLVLEEHGHCEVPAGCGGVVLRWRDPHAVLPVTLYLYAPVAADCFLDGVPLEQGRVDLAPGRHLLAVHLADVDLSGGLIMFAALHDPKEYQKVTPAEVVEEPMKVLSAADGSWKYVLDQPPDDWTAPAFDDAAWSALVRVATPKLEWQDHGSYQCSRCEEAGAVCLGLPSRKRKTLGRRSIWVRKAFDVPGPRWPEAEG